MGDKLKELWNKYKLVVFVVVPLLVLAWARDLIIDFLVSSSKKLVDDTTKKSDQLKAEENKANTQADQIIADADKKSENKPKVDEDWNK